MGGDTPEGQLKARVTDRESAHVDVAVFAYSRGYWALTGTMRPRRGREADNMLQTLTRAGVPLEDERGEPVSVPTFSGDQWDLERRMREALRAIASKLGIPVASSDVWALNNVERVHELGEDMLREIDALRSTSQMWDAARRVARADLELRVRTSDAAAADEVAAAIAALTEIVTGLPPRPAEGHGG